MMVFFVGARGCISSRSKAIQSDPACTIIVQWGASGTDGALVRVPDADLDLDPVRSRLHHQRALTMLLYGCPPRANSALRSISCSSSGSSQGGTV